MRFTRDHAQFDAHHDWLVWYKVEIGEKRISGILADGLSN